MNKNGVLKYYQLLSVKFVEICTYPPGKNYICPAGE